MPGQSKYNFSDYCNKRVWNVTPIREVEESAKDGSKQWEFRCICGKTFIDSPHRIISGHKKSCGCMRHYCGTRKKYVGKHFSKINPEDYIGKKNNRLTVIGSRKPESGGRLRLVCKCDCGNTMEVFPYQFSSGKILSCGCARFGHSDCHKGNTSRRTHNLSRDPFYQKWCSVMSRCYKKTAQNYPRYGGVGVTVCDEWRNGPEKFIDWCHETFPKEGDGPFSIDRIDGSKGYSPDNCKWSTPMEQSHNIKTNRNITINGETNCVAEWCRIYGINTQSVYGRSLKKGISVEESLFHFIERAKAMVASGASR